MDLPCCPLSNLWTLVQLYVFVWQDRQDMSPQFLIYIAVSACPTEFLWGWHSYHSELFPALSFLLDLMLLWIIFLQEGPGSKQLQRLFFRGFSKPPVLISTKATNRQSLHAQARQSVLQGVNSHMMHEPADWRHEHGKSMMIPTSILDISVLIPMSQSDEKL